MALAAFSSAVLVFPHHLGPSISTAIPRTGTPPAFLEEPLSAIINPPIRNTILFLFIDRKTYKYISREDKVQKI
jgi:hypothetical protein